ncbi:subtilase-type protease inhibitor [Arthrobacter sp. TMN-37]
MAPETPPPPPETGGTRLLISIQDSPEAAPVEYVLECVEGKPGPGTSLPNAESACSVVDRLGTKFFTARPDRNIVCTDIYGGPQTASITGTVNGETIRARFARTNGCEISRWDAVRDILGTGGEF